MTPDGENRADAREDHRVGEAEPLGRWRRSWPRGKEEGTFPLKSPACGLRGSGGTAEGMCVLREGGAWAGRDGWEEEPDEGLGP